MPHKPGPPRVARWEYGPILVTYGAFSIRECWKVFDGIRRLHFHEIVFMATPSSPNQDAETISIALIGLRRIDLVYVVRWARLWVNGRRHALAMHRRALSYPPDDDAYASGTRVEAQSVPEETQDKRQTRHPDTARDDDSDEAAAREEKVWEEEMERETELVAHALQELEAQHPELDLEPLEETITADPELLATLQRMGQDDGEHYSHGADRGCEPLQEE